MPDKKDNYKTLTIDHRFNGLLRPLCRKLVQAVDSALDTSPEFDITEESLIYLGRTIFSGTKLFLSRGVVVGEPNTQIDVITCTNTVARLSGPVALTVNPPNLTITFTGPSPAIRDITIPLDVETFQKENPDKPLSHCNVGGRPVFSDHLLLKPTEGYPTG